MLIVLSGAAVRLTGSGLGCSDWPRCEQDRFVAPVEYHAMIEFANRLVSFVVAATVILILWGALRRVPYRRDLLTPAVWIAVFTAVQVILGGITVRMDLWPPIVMAHFLFSMVLLWLAVTLVHRASTEPIDSRPNGQGPTAGLARLHPLVMAMMVAAAVVLVNGTVVTGSGPHGGDETVERLGFYVPTVARLHAVSVFVFLGLVLLVLIDRRTRSQPALVRVGSVLLMVTLAQGALGYYQYFNGVPALAVFLHVAGAMAVFGTTVWFALEHRRQTLATRPTPADPVSSAR